MFRILHFHKPFLASLLLGACLHTTARTVSLRLHGSLRDASVTIDDQYLGSLAFVMSRGVALPPGQHRITVERPGYFPWDRLVDAKEQLIALDVKLEPIPE